MEPETPKGKAGPPALMVSVVRFLMPSAAIADPR
jgi:hypothetical protein